MNFLARPSLENIDYWIVGWGGGDATNYCKMRYSADAAGKSMVDSVGYDGWPDPLDTSTKRAYIWAIYCSYSVYGMAGRFIGPHA